MSKRIVEGLWDCPYCKSTEIGGLTKHCPCCGHPQDAGTKFYMGKKRGKKQQAQDSMIASCACLRMIEKEKHFIIWRNEP